MQRIGKGKGPREFKITEVPGQLATQEQLAMLVTRYVFAKSFSRDRVVVEVACGGGQGLRFVAGVASFCVGGDLDIDALLLPGWAGRSPGRVSRVQLDAHLLPFRDASVDVVVLFDSIYWLRSAETFACECRRVLKSGGQALISTVNTAWKEFVPSPYGTRYLSATELRNLFCEAGFAVTLYAAFPVDGKKPMAGVVSLIRRFASRLGLIPTGIRAKEALKRVFYGELKQIPAQICEGTAPWLSPQQMGNPSDGDGFKLLYMKAEKTAGD